MTCDRCYRPLSLGEHGVGLCAFEPRRHGGASVEAVTWPGGKTFENLASEPITFYQRTDYERYLKTHRIEEFVRHVPVPGSDKSPHTTSWAAISQETLDGAKAMLERVGTASATETRTWVERFIPASEVGVTRVTGVLS